MVLSSSTYRSTYRWATALLLLMVALFFTSLLLEGKGVIADNYLRILRAFSEAAMIGALADWFAVTALFRHPLGLPIPHTAIVPRNQARIGEALGSFITENFLSPQELATRTVRLDVAGTVSGWLTAEGNPERVAKYVVQGIPTILTRFGEERLNRVVRSTAQSVMGSVDLPSLAADLGELLTASKEHEIVLDEGLRYSWRLFEQNKAWVRQRIHQVSPWFVPRFVDQRIYESIVAQTEQLFHDVSNTPTHPLRLKFREFLGELITSLRTNEDLRKRFTLACQGLLANDHFRGYIDSLRRGLIGYLQREGENSVVASSVAALCRGFGENVRADPELQGYLNEVLGEFFRHIATHQRQAIGSLIADTVKSWDSVELVQKLEQYVGRDLQFIRINGTLVGGALGLLLYGIGVFAARIQ